MYNQIFHGITIVHIWIWVSRKWTFFLTMVVHLWHSFTRDKTWYNDNFFRSIKYIHNLFWNLHFALSQSFNKIRTWNIFPSNLILLSVRTLLAALKHDLEATINIRMILKFGNIFLTWCQNYKILNPYRVVWYFHFVSCCAFVLYHIVSRLCVVCVVPC
jgi:hypothetical protein